MLDGTPFLTLSERLPDCTVYQAEARAIQMAIELLQTLTSTTPIHIHVDCQSVLKALTAPYIYTETMKYTRDLLQNLGQNQEISLQWVKAHIGIPGNEAADTAAKAGGTSTRQTTQRIGPPRASRKKHIRKARNLAWQTAWNQRKDCRQSKMFLPGPDPNIWKDIKSLPQAKISRIIRFTTGHCHMNRQNTIIAQGYEALDSQEAMCRLCEEAEETPEHLITECPVLNTTRLSHLYAWQLDTPPPWSQELIQFINSPAVIAIEESTPTGM